MEHPQQSSDQLVLSGHVLNGRSGQGNPIAATINLNAIGQRTVADAPHMYITFDEGFVQTLFLFESLHFATVRFNEISISIRCQKIDQTVDVFH